MPALANSKVGSSSGTTLADGTKVWPCFLTKKSMNCWRISLAVNMKVSRQACSKSPDRAWLDSGNQPQGERIAVQFPPVDGHRAHDAEDDTQHPQGQEDEDA